MTEENKKRINKLMIPFTKRTLSFLTAATILATGTVGCREKEENDTSSIISTVSDEEITSSDKELTIDDNIQSDTNEELDTVQNNNEVTNNITSNNNKVNSNNSNKNNQTNNSTVSNNTNNTSSVTTPSVNTPVETPSAPIEPTMPSTLTADNINDVEVFKHFSKKMAGESFPNSSIYSYNYEYNGQKYSSDGQLEFQLLLVMLNYQYIDTFLLKELFQNCSLDDLKRFSIFIDIIIQCNVDKGIIYNFNNYCIDKSVGTYLIDFQSKLINARKSNNYSDIEELFKKYFIYKNGNYYYGSSNVWVDFYLINYESLLSDYFDDELYYGSLDLYSEIKKSYNNMIDTIYNSIKTKTKVYQ